MGDGVWRAGEWERASLSACLHGLVNASPCAGIAFVGSISFSLGLLSGPAVQVGPGLLLRAECRLPYRLVFVRPRIYRPQSRPTTVDGLGIERAHPWRALQIVDIASGKALPTGDDRAKVTTPHNLPKLLKVAASACTSSDRVNYSPPAPPGPLLSSFD